jgi:hypothetical protein
VAVLNPQHIFEQAEKLIVPPPAGPPRQVDIRRAISAAYYAVFHFVLAAAADEFIGSTKRNTPLYSLVYRSIDHRGLRDLCNESRKQHPGGKYQKYVPGNGFGPDIRNFADGLVELQERRHSADYDPSVCVKTSDALIAIAQARSAVNLFKNAEATERKTFLSLLLFSPR